MIFIILFFPIYISIIIKKNSDNNFLIIKLNILKIINYKYELNLGDLIKQDKKMTVKTNEEANASKRSNKRKTPLQIGNIIKYYNKLNNKKNVAFIEYIFKKVKVINLKIILNLGLDDAAITALVNGFIQSILYLILSIFQNLKNIDDYFIDIVPQFNRSIFHINFNCIIKLKLVYIIIAGYESVKVKIKGGVNNV